MKKIAVYLQASPEGGGFFQYAEILLEALAESSLQGQADIRCWYRGEHWAERIRSFGLKGVPAMRFANPCMRWRNSLRKRWLRLRCGKNSPEMQKADIANCLIDTWKPDLIINAQSSFFIPSRPTPQIAPVHDLMHMLEPSFPEVGTAAEIAHRNTLYQGLCRHCSTIMVDSHLGAEHVARYFTANEEQFLVLPYAAPQSLLACEARKPATALPEDFLFYPAQFWKHKNHLRLLEAVRLAKEQFPDIHCVCTGSIRHEGYEPFIAALREQGMEGAVSVLGYVDSAEIAWLYRHARGLVMPTFFGPTNIPPLEAMALGCPAAVSDIYAMREQCGDAVLYFDPLDAGGMAQCIAELWGNESLRRILRERGLARHGAWNAEHMKQRFVQRVREELGLQDTGDN